MPASGKLQDSWSVGSPAAFMRGKERFRAPGNSLDSIMRFSAGLNNLRRNALVSGHIETFIAGRLWLAFFARCGTNESRPPNRPLPLKYSPKSQARLSLIGSNTRPTPIVVCFLPQFYCHASIAIIVFGV